jgi:hypothetical protein
MVLVRRSPAAGEVLRPDLEGTNMSAIAKRKKTGRSVEPWRVGKWVKFLAISRDRDGHWLNVEALGDETCPRWGPYHCRAEAVEVARSYLRNALSKPWLQGTKKR